MAEEGTDLIQYIDLGDRTLEIDNRGPVQQRRVHPKALTSVSVTPQVRHELEERIEQEVRPLIEVRLEEAPSVDGSTLKGPDDLPEVEDWEAVRERERVAAEQLQAANEVRAADEGVSEAEQPPPSEPPKPKKSSSDS